MERIKTNRVLHIVALFLLSGIFYCCIDERDKYEAPVTGQQKSVTFSVKVPGAGAPRSPETRALTQNDENAVKQIVVLLFEGSGNYVHYPIYSNNITTDPGDNTKKTFTVKVPEGTYDMVILANANTSLGTVLSSINAGDSKTSVISKLTLTNTGKWDTNSSSGSYKPIPMWGEITGITVSSSMPSGTPVTLSRMVSKIDVSLATTIAQNSFDLKSVHLYNYNDRGQLAPDAANWNSATNIVAAPSVPSTAQKLGNPTANPATQPLLYDGTAITKDPAAPARGISCSNEIYAFEAAAGSEADHLTNTCLVIGGRYSGDTQDSYYRIDLANTSGTTASYLPLLRNHQYKININKISGPGLATPEDAFKARPVNIEASIVRWNDGRFRDFAVNDQYLVGVSQAEFTFTREARTNASDDNILSVITDYPGGWMIEKITDINGSTTAAAWLTCSTMQGSNPSGDDIKLRMPVNNTGNPRTAFIHIKAERLVYIVKVTQQVTANVGISIVNANEQEINSLEFVSKFDEVIANIQPPAQQFKVGWSPGVSSLFFSTNTLTGNAFAFYSGNGMDAIPGSGNLAGSSGPKTYTIRPVAITTADLNTNPFYERSSVILYQVSDGGSSTVTKTLALKQYVCNIVPVVEPVYLMDGGTKTFAVRSNSPFTVEIDPGTNTDGVIVGKIFTPGTVNTSAEGTLVYFNIINDLNNNSLLQRTVKVIIKSPTGLFPDTPVSLNCVSGIIQPKANSYIVAPNSIPILIPVSRANESSLGTQLNVGDAFTAGLVWTDNGNRVAANSNIKMINAIGKGAGGYVLVMPGSASGNAVVCIKNSSNQILWSWHIWVTAYTPVPIGTNKFMDRNLGAIGDTPGAVGTKGLFYQWGRKDPFPGSTTINGTTEPILYKASGTTTIAKTLVTATNNLGNSVANPATFYTSNNSTDPDWYGTVDRDGALWGANAAKSPYDPCPDGWQVPPSGSWNNINFGFVWNSSTLGRTHNNYGGFYPAAGMRYPTNGNFTNVGERGGYWSATISSSLYFENTGVYPTYPAMRPAYGLNVRCVRE